MEENPVLPNPLPAGAPLLPCEEGDPPSSLVPIRVNESITMRELTDDFFISSVLECDATGCVPPRAVALDSPLDILHGGKYYIARRDVPRLGRSPRVTFRGKILVEEFDLNQALVNQGEGSGVFGNSSSGAVSSDGTAATQVPTVRGSATRKRCACDMDGEEMEEEEEGGSLYNSVGSVPYTFVPYVGDLYGDGHEALIQMSDVKRLCENVELDEAEFNARHAQAESILAEAREALLSVSVEGVTTMDSVP